MTRWPRDLCRLSLLVVALLTAGRTGWAGGPIDVTTDGRIFAWDGSRPIAYTMDPGGLGPYSNVQATQWVADAFKAWSSVQGVQFSVQPTAPHPVDITGRNVEAILDARPNNVSLIIMDHDGSVMGTLLGYGAGEGLAGVAFPELFDARNARILQATVIINGNDLQRYRPEWVRGSLIEHELGHFLGLTHSQLNPDVVWDGDPTNDALAPRMSYNDGPNSVPGLHLEDRAWIAALYPRPNTPSTTGAVRGRVLLPDGVTGLQGIQVIARREGDPRVTAVSGISGYRYKAQARGGSRDAALWGVYDIPGLPPGRYQLTVEPLDSETRVYPVHGVLPGGKRFWRETRPLAARSEEATPITIVAGQTLEGRDFVLDGDASTPRTVAESEPNFLAEFATPLSLPGIVTGRVGAGDEAFLEVDLDDGRVDAVEDFHRIVVSEPVVLTATLSAANSLQDAQLYVIEFYESLSTFLPLLVAESAERGTPPETIQIRLDPGIYFLGVSNPDSSNAAVDYRLTVQATPVAEDQIADPVPPRITFAAISHLTQTSFRMSVITDRETSAVLNVERPLREFGSATLGKEHTIAVTGLTRRSGYQLDFYVYDAAGVFDTLPYLALATPAANSGSTPFLAAGLTSAIEVDAKKREMLLFARILNLGDAAAANVRIERLALPAGWRYVGPPRIPVDMGAIGVGAAAILVVRVEKAVDTPAPLNLSIEGTYETLTGAVVRFRR